VLKLLFTAAIVGGVWYLFKGKTQVSHRTMSKLGRAFGAARRAMSESADNRRETEQGPPQQPPKSKLPVELKPCPRCGTYIAVGMTCTCAKS
jgi:hypothetical protein